MIVKLLFTLIEMGKYIYFRYILPVSIIMCIVFTYNHSNRVATNLRIFTNSMLEVSEGF